RAADRGRRRDTDRDATGARGRPCRAERRLLHRRRRPRDARKPKRPGRREPTREPRDPQARTGDRGARGPRLRSSGRRQGDRRPRARASALAQARALGAAHPAGGRRAGAAGDGADAPGRGRAPGRVSRAASPKLVAYATLGGLGLLAALVTGRPELAAIALPFRRARGAALVLAADPQVEVESVLERGRLLEGDEVGVELRLSAKHAVQRAEVLLVVPPALSLVDGRNPTATYASTHKPAT